MKNSSQSTNKKADLEPKMCQNLDFVPQSEVNEVQEKSQVQREVQIEVQEDIKQYKSNYIYFQY